MRFERCNSWSFFQCVINTDNFNIISIVQLFLGLWKSMCTLHAQHISIRISTLQVFHNNMLMASYCIIRLPEFYEGNQSRLCSELANYDSNPVHWYSGWNLFTIPSIWDPFLHTHAHTCIHMHAHTYMHMYTHMLMHAHKHRHILAYTAPFFSHHSSYVCKSHLNVRFPCPSPF